MGKFAGRGGVTIMRSLSTSREILLACATGALAFCAASASAEPAQNAPPAGASAVAESAQPAPDGLTNTVSYDFRSPGDPATGQITGPIILSATGNGQAAGIQSPRDGASGQATGAVQSSTTPAPDHEIEYDLVRKRTDHEGEIDCVINCAAPSGQATGRRQHEPVQIMAGPGDGADGPPAQVQGNANSWLGGSDDGNSIRTVNPNQAGAAGASAPGAAAANTANAIEISPTDAGPPKPSAPTVGEPGAVKKNPSRRRPRTRKPGS